VQNKLKVGDLAQLHPYFKKNDIGVVEMVEDVPLEDDGGTVQRAFVRWFIGQRQEWVLSRQLVRCDEDS
jgi:hypothetical protein